MSADPRATWHLIISGILATLQEVAQAHAFGEFNVGKQSKLLRSMLQLGLRHQNSMTGFFAFEVGKLYELQILPQWSRRGSRPAKPSRGECRMRLVT